MEEKQVFHRFHSLILALLKAERISGLRVDHLDGLYNPAEYLERLRAEIGPDTYLVVEKILGMNEELLSSWPIQGTTGYDFLNHLNGLFCDRRCGQRFQEIYSDFTGLNIPYETILYEKKRLIIEKNMAGDVDALARLLKRISIKDRYGSDITLNSLKKAIVELLALFPIYRTYISYHVFNVSDRLYISQTIRKARKKEPDLVYEFNFIEQFLLLAFRDSQTEEEKKEWINFTMRFQQLTGPLMAKGLEDTTFYVYNRLLSLNEVGGDPSQFGITVEEFHEFNSKRARLWPYSMNATATHDTKRGEDARARINVLSELPEEWEEKLKSWSMINKSRKLWSSNGHIPIPDRNDEYFLYQTLIGAFPFDENEYPNLIERIKNYIIKAIREAKVHTAWIEPDTEYEQGFSYFIDQILNSSEQNQFLADFLPFQKKIAFYGVLNSLSQTLIKITSPGLPDFYQGTELWDFSLVDPDNRRPVDFRKRKKLLQRIRGVGEDEILGFIEELLANKEDGRIKFFLIFRALRVRGEKRDIFQQGEYLPLGVGGRWREHIVAFARRMPPSNEPEEMADRQMSDSRRPGPDSCCSGSGKEEDDWVITIAPRLLTSLVREGEYPLGRKVWDDTYLILPEGSPCRWREAIAGQEVTSGPEGLLIADALKYFPVALLISQGEGANKSLKDE